MKNYLIVVIILATLYNVHSQNQGFTYEILYTYDDLGNRVRRELIVMSPSPQAPNTQDKKDSLSNYNLADNNKLSKFDDPVNSGLNTKGDDNKKYESLLGERKVTVYPNPTKGDLRIEITNLNPDNKGKITINDVSGKLIQEIQNISSSNVVNISNIPNGSYVMQLVIEKKRKEWVVVKE
jgi:hypothetical protein